MGGEGDNCLTKDAEYSQEEGYMEIGCIDMLANNALHGDPARAEPCSA
jgi:hypothetical protein